MSKPILKCRKAVTFNSPIKQFTPSSIYKNLIGQNSFFGRGYRSVNDVTHTLTSMYCCHKIIFPSPNMTLLMIGTNPWLVKSGFGTKANTTAHQRTTFLKVFLSFFEILLHSKNELLFWLNISLQIWSTFWSIFYSSPQAHLFLSCKLNF